MEIEGEDAWQEIKALVAAAPLKVLRKVARSGDLPEDFVDVFVEDYGGTELQAVLVGVAPGGDERLFELACERDLEGIVAKHRGAPYSLDPTRTSWCKTKNPDYSQAKGRHELFAARLRRPSPYRKQPLGLAI